MRRSGVEPALIGLSLLVLPVIPSNQDRLPHSYNLFVLFNVIVPAEIFLETIGSCLPYLIEYEATRF